MGGKGGSAPATPDYAGLSEQDAAAQMRAAAAITGWNRPTQSGPYGTISWEKSNPDTTSIDAQIAALRERGPTQGALGPRPVKPSRGGFGGGGGAERRRRRAMDDYKSKLSAWEAAGGEAAASGSAAYDRELGDLQAQRDQMLSPENTTWTQKEEWDPEVKADMDRAMEIARRQQQALVDQGAYQGVDMVNMEDFSGQDVSDALYESVMGRARPEQEREREAIDLRLRQQGLQPGTEAYDRAMTNLMTAHGDVATQAGYAATIGGADEARKQYEMALRGQQQEYNQNLQDYVLPWEQASMAQSMVGGQYRPSFQGFSGATGYNPASMSQAAQAQYNAGMGQYNAGQQKKGNLLGAGTTLGAAALISDSVLKEDITPLSDPITKLMEIQGVEWKWVGLNNVDSGIIAQEVAERFPELVDKARNGLLSVNYTGLFAILLEAVKELADEKSTNDD